MALAPDASLSSSSQATDETNAALLQQLASLLQNPAISALLAAAPAAAHVQPTAQQQQQDQSQLALPSRPPTPRTVGTLATLFRDLPIPAGNEMLANYAALATASISTAADIARGFTDDADLHAWLICLKGGHGGAPRIQLLMEARSVNVPAEEGGPQNPHHNSILAWTGDIVDGEAPPTVIFDPQWLVPGDAAAVPSVTETQGAMASADPTVELLPIGTIGPGAPAGAAAGVKAKAARAHTVSVPRVVWVPPALALALLNVGGNVAPTTAWRLLRERATALGALIPTKPVWEWLRRVVIDHDTPIPERIDALEYAPLSPAILRARRAIRENLLHLATHPPITTLTAVTSTAGAIAGANSGAYAGANAGAHAGTNVRATAGAAGTAAANAVAPIAAAMGTRPPAPNLHIGPAPSQATGAHIAQPPYRLDTGIHINTARAGASVQFAATSAMEEADFDGDEVDKKSPAYVWRYVWERLMRFTGVSHEDELRALWPELARATKSERRPIFESEVRRTSRRYSLAAPSISHTLLSRFIELDLARDDTESPTAGLSVYLLAGAFADSGAARRQANRLWDEVLRGDATPTMQETAAFFAEDGVPPICHWEDATDCVERTAATLITALGEYHEVAGPMLHFVQWLQTKRQLFARRARSDPCLAHDLVQRIHLDLGLWLESVEDEDGPLMLPNWDLLQHVLAGNNMLVNQRPQRPRREGAAPWPGMGAAQGSAAGGGGQNRGALADVSAAAVRQLRNNDNNPLPQTPVANLRQDPDLIIPNGVGLKACVTACKNAHPPGTPNGGLPLSDAGNPMCLAYHLVGRCNSRCGNRAHSHQTPSAGEKGGMVQFRTTYCVPCFLEQQQLQVPRNRWDQRHNGGGNSGGGGYQQGGNGGGFQQGGGGGRGHSGFQHNSAAAGRAQPNPYQPQPQWQQQWQQPPAHQWPQQQQWQPQTQHVQGGPPQGYTGWGQAGQAQPPPAYKNPALLRYKLNR